MSNFSKTISKLPSKSGVYLFKNKAGQILYIGKASNLKKRVASYFQKTNLAPDKERMLKKIAKVEHIVTDSEIEALILEANLIKKYSPKYNIAFKDDKQYQYIKIERNDDFPRICTARKMEGGGADYFGPFPSSQTVRQILNLLNRLFHYRQCKLKLTENGVKKKKYKLCLRYYLGRCLGPCIGKISKKEYAMQIRQCKMFLEGREKRLLKSLENKMKVSAKNQNFEEAVRLRDQITGLKNTSSQTMSHLWCDRIKDRTSKKRLLELADILNLELIPRRIECFDISNIQGKAACGSMVVFENGKPCKSEYRRFKIRTKSGPNDVAMMEEVLLRRFRHSILPPLMGGSKREGEHALKITPPTLTLPQGGNCGGPKTKIREISLIRNEFHWPLPDLIVIDGGKAQLGVALKVLKKYRLKIPAIALAKKKEEIYLPHHPKPLQLPRNSKVLFLLQNLRDEAHRFAIIYHKKLRRKMLIKNS